MHFSLSDTALLKAVVKAASVVDVVCVLIAHPADGCTFVAESRDNDQLRVLAEAHLAAESLDSYECAAAAPFAVSIRLDKLQNAFARAIPRHTTIAFALYEDTSQQSLSLRISMQRARHTQHYEFFVQPALLDTVASRLSAPEAPLTISAEFWCDSMQSCNKIDCLERLELRREADRLHISGAGLTLKYSTVISGDADDDGRFASTQIVAGFLHILTPLLKLKNVARMQIGVEDNRPLRIGIPIEQSAHAVYVTIVHEERG